ncbi:hypothetical protein F5Y16DRAFT_393456 [Xylariaceae sp. FL0255]|nr:hypothetical protein F5Y16DRAFT_393456 [Xylariaceae sp. FL0255]
MSSRVTRTMSRRERPEPYPQRRVKPDPARGVQTARAQRERNAAAGQFRRRGIDGYDAPEGQTLAQFYGFPRTARQTRDLNEMVRICPIAGKGMGMRARRAHVPGTILISEPPILSVNAVNETECTRAVQALLKPVVQHENLEDLFSLGSTRDPDTEYELIRTNIWESTDLVGGRNNLYFGTAHINHSCRPNATIIVAADRWAKVQAINNIAQGEEITVDYQDFDHWGWSHPTEGVPMVAAVQASLSRVWEFTCTCPACANPIATNIVRNRINVAERAMNITNLEWPLRPSELDEVDARLAQYIDDLISEQCWTKCKDFCNWARKYYEGIRDNGSLNARQSANLAKAYEFYAVADEHANGAPI